ncbi:MAG: hypothetical protein KDC25_06550 [Saprospiraceae bacterium]|nr:hypothetical protein [Saprospiraceae bacterium]
MKIRIHVLNLKIEVQMKKKYLLPLMILIVTMYSYTMYIGLHNHDYQSYIVERQEKDVVAVESNQDESNAIEIVVQIIDRVYQAVTMINKAAN